jgi:hypothetical protein
MKILLIILVSSCICGHLLAQEHQDHSDTLSQKKVSSSTKRKNINRYKAEQHRHSISDTTNPGLAEHMHDSILMTHAYSKNLPMSRNGSGTAWVPDSSPMYMYMHGNKRSNWMVHGNVVLRYNKQDLFDKGFRGDTKVDAPNWFMGMYNRLVGSRGLLNATAMISFDAISVGGRGYPLLFQSGETYNGNRLVDRQHPHDFISGLSVGYTHMVNKDVDLTTYFGYPGEPALGPTAFMHRISALNNPDAVLGHHWQDATHIMFGVGTVGLRYKDLKLEGSIFTGREPDENRYNFDMARFDSYSYRISFNPTPDYSIQFSQGFLHEPEMLEPGVDVTRTTASIMRSQSLRTMNWSQTLVWGMNDKEFHRTKEHSVLYENNLQFQGQAIYGRYEYVRKSAEELELETTLGPGTFNIHTLTLGYNRNISPAAPVEILAGLQTTINFPDKRLKRIYGSVPVGLEIYLQLRPRRHRHDQ